MNGDCQIIEEGLCGCCAGVTADTPQPITNRPSLPQIAYRVGTHGQFKASLLAALSDPDFSALAGLRTRDDSDFTIALLDAFAVSADILSFYQERLANEAYLRTAVDQRSVFELARLVGYRPAPGVSASTFVAFNLNSAPGSPDNVLIAAGTRVQSVPGPGQSPAVFETSRDITAQIAYDSLKVQTTLAWTLAGSDQSTWIAGTGHNINVGDTLLFVIAPAGVPAIEGPADLRYITAAIENIATGNTNLFWDRALSIVNAPSSDVCIYIFRKKAALFGLQAPSPALFTSLTAPPPPAKLSGSDWYFVYGNNQTVNLDASYPGLSAISSSNSADQLQWLVLTGPKYTSCFQISAASESNPNLYSLSVKTTRLTVSLCCVISGDPYLNVDQVLNDFTAETRNTTAYVQSELLDPADIPITNWADTPFQLSAGTIVPVQGSLIAILGGQQINVNQPIGIQAQRIRLQVLQNIGTSFTPSVSSGLLGTATGQIFLVNSYPPTSTAVAGTSAWNVRTLSGIDGILVIRGANVQLLPADKKDPFTTEAAVVGAVSVNGDITTLSLTAPLAGIYDATTMSLNANVAPASHGETMHEILGSGDATNAALQFTLKQSPLTYVSAAVEQGAVSTLQVWVNNLLWHEVDNFLNSGPNDRVFVTVVNGDGSVSVQFGDGVNGARTSTGQMNIRAVYRKGIGLAGMVQAGQLTQPLDRPQGLQTTLNPSPATGGADADTADAARVSAPLHVLTLDRVVSLEDYQNTALAFQGISKALATWTWFGSVRGVFLTIAGSDGFGFQDGDPTIINLIGNLQSSGNPYVPLNVKSYSPIHFTIAANVQIDTNDYDPTAVLAAVWQVVSAAFAFDQRQLGQGVAQSQIIAMMQQTPGVIAVSLTQFYRNDQLQSSVPAVLRAASPVAGQNGSLQPAELLLLDPASQALIVRWS